MSLALFKNMQIQVRIILDKNTYFLKGQGQVGREIRSQRRPPHRHTKLKLHFLVSLVAMAAKIVIRMLAGSERFIFTYNLITIFVKKIFL